MLPFTTFPRLSTDLAVKWCFRPPARYWLVDTSPLKTAPVPVTESTLEQWQSLWVEVL